MAASAQCQSTLSSLEHPTKEAGDFSREGLTFLARSGRGNLSLLKKYIFGLKNKTDKKNSTICLCMATPTRSQQRQAELYTNKSNSVLLVQFQVYREVTEVHRQLPFAFITVFITVDELLLIVSNQVHNWFALL